MKHLLSLIAALATGCANGDRADLQAGRTVRAQTVAVRAGAERTAVCGGKKFLLDHATSGSAPYVTLSLEGKSGPFLIDYGASDSVVENSVWPIPDDSPNWTSSAAGRKYPLGPVDLPGWDAPAGKISFLAETRNIQLRPGVRQHGVLGADLFPNQIVHFDYEGADRAYISPYPAPDCAASTLEKAGFTRLAQNAHWADGTIAPDGIHNGPALYAHFLDARGEPLNGSWFWGQLDTGYDDLAYSHALIVNEALYNGLRQSGLSLTKVGSVTTRTCAGTAEAEVLAVREPLAITNDKGLAAGSVRDVHLIRSPTTPCGGISGSALPAGQFGASFLEAIGEVVLHGPRKEVWVKF